MTDPASPKTPPSDPQASGVPAPPDQAAHDPERWHTLWAETWCDYYSPTIAVSETTGAIRIEAGGRVVVKPVRAWIDAVWSKDEPPRTAPGAAAVARQELEVDHVHGAGKAGPTSESAAVSPLALEELAKEIDALQSYETQEIETMTGLSGHEDWLKLSDMRELLARLRAGRHE